MIKNTKQIIVKDIAVTLITHKEDDYISLTDIARYKNSKEPASVISHWLSTRFTVEFMGVWEQIHNPDFKVTEFSNFKNISGSDGFVLSVSQWAEKVNGIGIFAKRGRYSS